MLVRLEFAPALLRQRQQFDSGPRVRASSAAAAAATATGLVIVVVIHSGVQKNRITIISCVKHVSYCKSLTCFYDKVII